MIEESSNSSIESKFSQNNSSISLETNANASKNIDSTHQKEISEDVIVNEESNASVSASATFDAEANISASAGKDGVELSANIGQEAEASVEASVSTDLNVETPIGEINAGANVEGKVSVQEWSKAGVNAEAGKDGIAGSFDASVGYAAGTEITGELNLGPVKTKTSAEVSAGAQIGASGDAHAKFKDGVIDLGVEGKAAAIVGLEGDVNIKVDTKPIVKTVEKTIDVVKKPEKAIKDVKDEVKQKVSKQTNNVKDEVKKKHRRLKKLLKFRR